LTKLPTHARTESLTLALALFCQARRWLPYVGQPENLASAFLGLLRGNAEHLLKLSRGQHVNP
jgi:hypothetical protein